MRTLPTMCLVQAEEMPSRVLGTRKFPFATLVAFYRGKEFNSHAEAFSGMAFLEKKLRSAERLCARVTGRETYLTR